MTPDGPDPSATKLLLLLSPPRSGSTLLQRVLVTDPTVVTCPESWVVPSMLAMLSGEQFATEFGSERARRGLATFRSWGAQRGVDTEALMARAVIGVLQTAANGAPIVVEKTPRNSLYGRRLLEADESVLALVLVRNPVRVIASIVDSWRSGRWLLLNNRDFVRRVYHALADVVEAMPDRVVLVRYEDLIADPGRALQTVERRFGLSIDLDSMPSEAAFNVLTDNYTPTRRAASTSVSVADERTDATQGSYVRRRALIAFVESIGESNLATLGYSSHELLQELRKSPISIRRTLRDVPAAITNSLIMAVDPRHQLRRIRRRRLLS